MGTGDVTTVQRARSLGKRKSRLITIHEILHPHERDKALDAPLLMATNGKIMNLLRVFIVCSGLILTIKGSAYAEDAVKPKLGETKVTRTGKRYVDIYFAEGFKGKSVRLEVPCELNNDARLKEKGIPNDSILSMKIPDGIVVTLCANAGFGGQSMSFTGRAASLGELKGQASSLKAEAKQP